MSYFSRLSIDPASVNTARLAKEICINAYREHQHLWRLFEADPDAERDFLFRREQPANGFPRFYLLSGREPQHGNKVWRIETKAYRPVIHAGQQLAFSLRVNPVITRRDAHGRQVRHDVVMDLKHRIDFKNLPVSERPAPNELVQQAGLEWLQARAGRHGFAFSPGKVQVEGYQRHRATKKGGKKPIRYSTLDFTGLLTVAEPDLFQQTLTKGMGPAKAFGCGLLLVRRA
jgi:CRISPR system Cascade subunit CasE